MTPGAVRERHTGLKHFNTPSDYGIGGQQAMGISEHSFESGAKAVYGFRPWVRRAGLSVLLVAVLVTAVLIVGVAIRPSARFGWAREPFVWAYIGVLWLGGLRIYLGTFRPAAEIHEARLVLRPLHQMKAFSVGWDAILGTEQMIGGDRMILYHQTRRGMRFVAINLNLVKGRRDFLNELDARLRGMGFAERIVARSRYLSRVKDE